MPQTVEVRQDVKMTVASAAQRVMQAKARKKAAKEELDKFLDHNEDYRGAAEIARDGRSAQKLAKDKLLSEKDGKKIREVYEDSGENLKAAEEFLSTALEALFVKEGKFEFATLNGANVTMKRKFGLPANQLKLFE